MKTTFALAAAAALLGGCASYPDSHLVSAPPPAAPAVVATPVSTPVMVQTTQGQVIQTAQGQIVATPVTYVVTQAPPALQTEIVPTQPSPSHAWVPGRWTWRNSRYEWVAGHWELPPQAGAIWTQPHYEREGSSYRYYEGYWKY